MKRVRIEVKVIDDRPENPDMELAVDTLVSELEKPYGDAVLEGMIDRVRYGLRKIFDGEEI